MEALFRLRDLAASQSVARITYKKTGEDWHSDRVVEPYSLTYSGKNLIVLTWQVEPALDGDSWRNFRVDRIGRVANGGRPFTPRIPITLHLGEVSQFVLDRNPDAAPVSSPSEAERYFRFLEDALLDGHMSDAEAEAARRLGVGLDDLRRRAIHGQVYANLINEVCMDGEISEGDAERLRNMRFFLTELGWSP